MSSVSAVFTFIFARGKSRLHPGMYPGPLCAHLGEEGGSSDGPKLDTSLGSTSLVMMKECASRSRSVV